MTHMVIAVPMPSRPDANSKGYMIGSVKQGELVFGDGQKRIHRDTKETWYVVCGPVPEGGLEAFKGRFSRPDALYEEFSLIHDPEGPKNILDKWGLDLPPESSK